MIIYLHFFLYDLHHQLSVNYEGTNPRTKIEKYFRGQIMTSEEIKKLQELSIFFSSITLNSFLSTTKDYQMALTFAGSGCYEKDDELQSVVFTIQLLPNNFNPMDREYADITHLSACPTEQETLFTLTSMLFIDAIQYDEREKTWFVALTNWSTIAWPRYESNTTEKEHQYCNSTDIEFINVGRQLAEKVVGFNIFDLFDEEHRNDPPVTEESFNTIKSIYYNILLENSLINQFVYDVGLGSLAFMSGNIDIAAQYLLKALPSVNPIHSNYDDELLLLLYDTLGHVYREKYEYNLALQYYSESTKIASTAERLDDLASVYKILGDYEHALTILSNYTRIARAYDKCKDSMTNIKEWKSFVDYTASNKNYLSQYHFEINREYEEIGKKYAGISSQVHLYNNGNYRLKGYEIPGFSIEIPIDQTSLQVAIECFQHIIDICNQVNSNDNSRNISPANEYVALINAKLSEFNISTK